MHLGIDKTLTGVVIVVILMERLSQLYYRRGCVS
jgi:hypothetical protein